MSGKGVIHKIKLFLKCKKEPKKNMCCRVHLNNNVLKKQKKKNRKNSKKGNLYNIEQLFPFVLSFQSFHTF